MPVLIQNPDHQSRSCNVCHKKNNVKEIYFKSEGGGIVVALCKDCRKDLIDQIKRYEKGK